MGVYYKDMTYNIHPIFVHFPIALLFLYSVIKIIPFQKWFPQVAWRQIERVLLVVGVLGAFVASSTGELAEHLTQPNRQLVEIHSLFAGASTWIYGLLLLGELLVIFGGAVTAKLNFSPLTKLVMVIQRLLTHRVISTALAFLGFIAISLTGLLGGVIVYGVSADPIAGAFLKLLGIQY